VAHALEVAQLDAAAFALGEALSENFPDPPEQALTVAAEGEALVDLFWCLMPGMVLGGEMAEAVGG
jgi:hypothetical protein